MYRDAVSKALQGRPRLPTHGWEHNGRPQASMDDNRRKAFMYSTNFRISKKYNLFRNRPVIYNLYEIKLLPPITVPITKFWAKLDLGATAPPHDGNHSTCGYLGVIWTP